jgi:hypothetical protein
MPERWARGLRAYWTAGLPFFSIADAGRRSPGPAVVNRRSCAASLAARELEDDLALSYEPELIARDSLDCRGIVAQPLHLAAELGHRTAEALVLAAHVGELALERPHAGEPLRLEDEDRDAEDRERQNADRENALEEARERRERGRGGGRGRGRDRSGRWIGRMLHGLSILPRLAQDGPVWWRVCGTGGIPP